MIEVNFKRKVNVSIIVALTILFGYPHLLLAEVKESLPRINGYRFNNEKRISKESVNKFGHLLSHVMDNSRERTTTKYHRPIAQLHTDTHETVDRYQYDEKKSYSSLMDSKSGSVIAGIAYSRKTKKPNIIKRLFNKEKPVDRMHIDLLLANPDHKGAGSQLLSKTILNEVNQIQSENKGKDRKLTVTLDALNHKSLIQYYEKFGFEDYGAHPYDDTTRRMGLVLDPSHPEDYRKQLDLIKSAH